MVKFFVNLTKNVFEDRVFDLSAQLAYFFMLSLFPFLIFIFSFLPYIGITQSQVIPFIDRFAPPELMDLITQNLGGAFNKHSGLLSFSVIATLWPMSTALMAIIRVMNRAYDVDESRSFFIARGMAVLLTIAMIFVMVIALVLNVFGPVIGNILLSHFDVDLGYVHIFEFLRLLISFLVIIAVFVLIYLFAPNKKLNFSDVIVGAVVAATLWQVVSLVFSFYVKQFNHYSTTYGTLGGIIILMVWFYLTGFVLILGGEINATLRGVKRRKI